MERAARSVDGDEIMVDAETVALGIAVREQPALQHLVGREANAVDDIERIERRLLDLGEEVLGVAVELQYTHVVKREIAVIPHLRQIERIDMVAHGLLFGHNLNLHLPAREVAPLDSLEQIALVRLAVLGDDRFGLGVGQVLYALHCAEVELDPCAAVVAIEEAVSVAAEAVHVAERGGYAARRHGNRHLMQRLGQQRPEVPVVVDAANARARIALYGMVQIGKLQRVAHEEYRSIVAHQIPVALVGVVLHREAADVALGVGRTPLAGHRRETHEARSLLAHLGEYRRTRPARDVVRDGKGAVCARTLGVHAPLGNHFAVEMTNLFHVPRILHQHGTRTPGGLDVLVVGDRTAVLGRKSFLVLVHSNRFYCNGQIQNSATTSLIYRSCSLNYLKYVRHKTVAITRFDEWYSLPAQIRKQYIALYSSFFSISRHIQIILCTFGILSLFTTMIRFYERQAAFIPFLCH